MFETLFRTDARGKSFAKPSECEYYQRSVFVKPTQHHGLPDSVLLEFAADSANLFLIRTQ